MNREEILAKSRAEAVDEGMREAESKGRQLGITAFTVMLLIIVIFNWCTGQSNNVPLAMFWAFAAAEAYPKYKFTQDKSFLVSTFIAGFCAVCFLSLHIFEVLR